ncbi:hypothetical protein [Leisingera sp. XS_AS12]|uniref:hypothetical protein n=1 Tax=Leisingera sp. XS_AS12 TaxID=3241294 RepID=UPI0035151995
MANLIFCESVRAMKDWEAQLSHDNQQPPFMLETTSHIPGAIQALKDGRDVVANAHTSAIGWRAPKGTTVVIDDGLRQPQFRALAWQCKARADGAFLYPHQLRTLQALRKRIDEEADPGIARASDPVSFGDRMRRRGQVPTAPVTVNLDAGKIMEAISKKRQAHFSQTSIAGTVPRHDLDEGLSKANSRETCGKLVIAADRVDAAVAEELLRADLKMDQPDQLQTAVLALAEGKTVVAQAAALRPGSGKRIQAEIEMTGKAADCSGAARVAIRICREALSNAHEAEAEPRPA